MSKRLKQEIKDDTTLHKLKTKKKETDQKYKVLVKEIIRLEREHDAILEVKKHQRVYSINSRKNSHSSEATAFLICSDWHIEERVDPATINGINSFDLDIAKSRVNKLFSNTVKVSKIMGKDIKIKNLVIGLLGDLISGMIHDELRESNLLSPIDATIMAKSMVSSGIHYLLKETDLKITVVAVSGNHSRVTEKRRISTEKGYSLEYFMYHILASEFKNEKRVKFVVAEGKHCYLDVYGRTIRFHHGDGIRYNGGVGGIYIPLNKAIAQWNKIKQHQ